MARDTSKHGRYYWCVGLKDEDKTEVLVMADAVDVSPAGALTLGNDTNPNLIFAPGEWSFCYAASTLDGHAVAVDHWPGQVVD